MPETQPKPIEETVQWAFGALSPAMDFVIDAAQRSILFLDVMRQRGNAFRERANNSAPHVLDYQFDLLIDGRKLDRPVNYVLVKIRPPAGIETKQSARPFVVVDPRAGHGPGIGGFKADSEIGVALKAGHPCYFIGFLPEPIPGQTIEDIARAEAIFLEKVISLHPQSNGRPCVIGNCQAGWAVMMLAAVRPELFGPLIIAGSPLSYWAGVHGKFPMRYTGGLLGGSWLTALVSDLGHGKFDGAWLVQNFENQNPANTLWTKQYNLYSKIDTEAARYLAFEKWWGGHVNLNAEEIQFIVDELFIGNKLASGQIKTSGNVSIDLRSIRSPIVVFCSKGDNVTPPQQALSWILDLYDNAEQIRSYGQTIVYTIHDTIGHLGIFVSSNVARKEHDEFSSNIDFIDMLPPGLYEAVFEQKEPDLVHPDLVSGQWIMRCESRSLEHIRALGGNDLADDQKFATAARISETNLGLYRTFAQPFVRMVMNSQWAEHFSSLHPLRLQYEMFSNANPWMAPVAALAQQVRQNRTPAAADNPFNRLQKQMSRQIVSALDSYREGIEAAAERTFLAVYGSPALQAIAGIDPTLSKPLRRAGVSPLHQQFIQTRMAELRSRLAEGGLRECLVRSILYVAMARTSVDERGFELVRRIRTAQQRVAPLSIAEFKSLVREQYFMLLIDEDAALKALPLLMPRSSDDRRKAISLIRDVVSARAEPTEEVAARLERIANLFNAGQELTNAPPIAPLGAEPREERLLLS
jgi:pimeloyl-ACP methyl ester carboxylesterase